jgi:predicted RNA binding protein YcfA (HicA-like mRNA interferase family)
MPPLTPVKRKKFEKFLKLIGCRLKWISGDHMIYDKVGLDRPVVITTDRNVPVFIIRNNLRTLKITPEDYLAIIKKI